jgi:tetratricopeptide (TPR) repeat protein
VSDESEDLGSTCPECGTDNPQGASACMACGGELSSASGPLGKIPTPVLVGGVVLVLLLFVGGGVKSLYTKSRPGSHTRAGMALLESGDFKEAGTEFKAALSYDKSYVPAIVGLAKVGVATKDQKLISRYAKDAIKKSEAGPTRAEMRVAYAWVLLEGGGAREALNQAIDALEDDGSVEGINAIRGLAALAIDPPQKEDAVTFLKKAAARKSERFQVYEKLAELLLERDEFEAGRDAARAAVKLDEESVAMWLVLGKHLEGLEDWKGYRQALQKVLKLEPQNALAHSRLSEVFLREESMEKALEHAQAAAKHDPENFEARLAVGRILLAYGRPHNARKELEKAIKLHDTWEAGYLLGKSELLTDKGGSSLRRIRDALKKAPSAESLPLWIEISEIALKKKLARDLKTDLETLIKAHGSNYDLRLLAARTYVADDPHRSKKLVLKHLQRAVQLDSSRREASVVLGKFHEKVGDLEAAIEAWNLGLKNDPRDKDLLYLKGCAATKAKLWKQAVSAFKQLKEIDERYKDVKVKLEEAQNGLFYSKNKPK